MISLRRFGLIAVCSAATLLVVQPELFAHITSNNTRHVGVHAWSEFIRSRVYTRGQADGRFLNVDERLPAFVASEGDDQELAHNTTEQLIFGDEIADTGDVYDPLTGVFTVPRTGFYHVSSFVSWALDADGIRLLRICSNSCNVADTLVQSRDEATGNTGGNIQSVSTVAFLEANDEVIVEAFHTAVENLDALNINGMGGRFAAAFLTP